MYCGVHVASLFEPLSRMISCVKEYSFKFHFRNCTERNLPHQRKSCLLGHCRFEDRLLELCFPRDCLDEGELVVGEGSL